MNFACLLLLSSLSFAWSKVIDINGIFDNHLESLNEVIRRSGHTTIPIPARKMDDNNGYSDGILTGLDSQVRTGNCTLTKEDTSSTYDLHYGLRLWVETFSNLRIDGKNMSAAYRIRDNSFHYSFTIDWSTGQCHVKVNKFQLERLWWVEFSASRPEYDGMNVNDHFQWNVLPFLNKYLFEPIKHKIERHLLHTCFILQTHSISKSLDLQSSVKRVLDASVKCPPFDF